MLRRFYNLSASITSVSLVLFVAISLFAASCSTDDEFTIYTSISGTVIDAVDSEPLSGVVVTIVPTNLSIATDKDGVFAFSDLKTQQYTISVQKHGYQPNRKVVTGVRGKNVEVVIPMSKISTH